MSASSDSLLSLADPGRAVTVDEATLVAASPDLLTVGMLGETVRKALHGDRVTYARVAVVGGPDLPAAGRGAATEVRLSGLPGSVAAALARVASARAFAEGATLTGFSLADLLELAGHDHVSLADLARRLAEAGLAAVAEMPIDRFVDSEHAVDVIKAVRAEGLGLWRLTVDRVLQPGFETRIALMERAATVADGAGGMLAFAPLARHDSREEPSTGYDDVKTVAIARLMCRSIPAIQIDWALYGPKLAQVAIAYGADDLDAVSPHDGPALGPRRAPKADIERHIRAAYAEPAERTAHFELRS